MKKCVRVKPGQNVRLVVPHMVSGEKDVVFYARVVKPMKRVNITIPEAGLRLFSHGARPAEMIRLVVSREKVPVDTGRPALEVLPQ